MAPHCEETCKTKSLIAIANPFIFTLNPKLQINLCLNPIIPMRLILIHPYPASRITISPRSMLYLLVLFITMKWKWATWIMIHHKMSMSPTRLLWVQIWVNTRLILNTRNNSFLIKDDYKFYKEKILYSPIV